MSRSLSHCPSGSSVAAAKPRGLPGKLARAGLAGLALGLGLLYFLESSDDRFNSISEFADRFPEEVLLGQVPQVGRERLEIVRARDGCPFPGALEVCPAPAKRGPRETVCA